MISKPDVREEKAIAYYLLSIERIKAYFEKKEHSVSNAEAASLRDERDRTVTAVQKIAQELAKEGPGQRSALDAEIMGLMLNEEVARALVLLRERAEQMRQTALAYQLADQARSLINDTMSSPDLIALLSIESIRRYPLKENDYNLRRIIPFLGDLSKQPHLWLPNPTGIAVIKASSDGRIVNFHGSAVSLLDPPGRSEFERLRKQLAELTGPDALAAVSNLSARNSARTPGVLVFSADGRYLATSAINGATRLFDSTGKPVRDFPRQPSTSSLVLSLGERYAASVAANGMVGVLEQSSVKPGSFITEGGAAMTFTPDGRYVAMGDRTGSVRVVRTADDQALFTFTVPGGLRSIDISPDGRYVAGSSWTAIIKVFDVSTMDEMRPLELAVGKLPVIKLLFSPRGNVVAVVDAVGGIRILDVDSARTELDLGLVPLLPPRSMFMRSGSITFSPDGTCLAFANPDQSISVFDLKSGQEVSNLLEEDILAVEVGTTAEPSVQLGAGAYYVDLKRPTTKGLGQVLALTFSSDRSRLTAAYRFHHSERYKDGLAGSEDDTLLVQYPLRSQDLIVAACGRLNRNLSQEEWHHYLGDEPYHKTCPNLR